MCKLRNVTMLCDCSTSASLGRLSSERYLRPFTIWKSLGSLLNKTVRPNAIDGHRGVYLKQTELIKKVLVGLFGKKVIFQKSKKWLVIIRFARSTAELNTLQIVFQFGRSQPKFEWRALCRSTSFGCKLNKP